MHRVRVCLLLAVCLPVVAQTTATIFGRVADPQGQALEGAIVRLRNPVTGLEREMPTLADGTYQIKNLPLQNYDLFLDVPGFDPVHQAVQLRSNVPVEQNIQLKLMDKVTILDVTATSQAVLLDPEGTGTRSELNIKAIDKLPVSPAARGLEGVLLSFPGFAANANGAIHPRGAHNQMTFVVDGMPISDQLTGAFANAVDPSLVESVDLFTGNVPAEFGSKVSGVAVVTTRSGIGSGEWFSGSLQAAAGSFDMLSTVAQFAGGKEKLGYFASFNSMKSNRYLDAVSLDNLHNGGNSERVSSRIDYQFNPSTIGRFNLMAGRSSFQLANLRSQHSNRQDQRQLLEDLSLSTGVLHTLNVKTTIEGLLSFRNAFANLYPSPGDTPVTAAQSRRLTNWNLAARLNRNSGRHNIRGGIDWTHFPVREHFSFAITDRNFNHPLNEDFNPNLLPYDLTRGGRWFHFGRANSGSLYSAFLQDQIHLGDFQIYAGLRFDNYRFLVHGTQWQPRFGVSYYLKKTGTVLRASYNRTFQTPPNENLLLASSPEAGKLAPPAVSEALGSASYLIHAERQNVIEAGVQQAFGRAVSLNASYYHKESNDLQDNDNFLNTGIIFPTSLFKSRVNGAEGRLSLFPGRRFSASLSGTHYHAVVTPPFTGGLFLGSGAIDALSAGPFIIDHDQTLGLQANVVYNFTKSLWTSFSVRHDSGLVSNPSDPAEVSKDPDYADLLPYVNLTSNPPRVNPRTVTDLAFGYMRQTGDGKRKWEAVFQVGNLFDRTALYNFQSIFVGTRVVQPLSASGRLRWYF